jgi:LPS-assembly protein
MKKHFAVFFLSLLAPLHAFSETLKRESSSVEPSMAELNKAESRRGGKFAGSGINIKAKIVTYDASREIIKASNGVEIDSEDHKLTADELTYDIARDEVTARGNVVATDKKSTTLYGDFIILKNRFKEGVISGLILYLPENVKVKADAAVKQGANFGSLKEASYTPCPTCNSRYPLWQVRAKQTDIDFDKERVAYKHAFFEIYGLPIFYVPYFAHPTPTAQAQSGILVPQIQDNSLRIPIYFRPKPNLDMTVTPRIMRHQTIYEGEFRHRLESGSYQITGSIAKDKRSKTTKNKDLRRARRLYRYHIISNGSFNQDRYNYGFLVEQSSDKSYMKNYGYGNRPYLTSRIYLDKAEDSRYYTLEAIKFQGLRKQDKHITDPTILPHIFYKQQYPHEDRTLLATLEGDVLAYNRPDGTRLNRASIKAIGTKKFVAQGHNINFSLYLRNDLYSATSLDSRSPYRRGNKQNTTVSKVYFIPEQHVFWKYPLLQLVEQGSYFEVEPQALLVLSGRHSKHKNYLINTDSQNLELKDDNLFHNNRYSGLDRHEVGSRASYGIKISTHRIDQTVNSSIFLGQLYKFKRHNNLGLKSGMTGRTSDLVGKITVDFNNTTDIYYKFAKHPRKISSQKEEVGVATTYKKISSSAIYSSVKNYTHLEEDRYLRQATFNIGYNFNSNWNFATAIRTNLSSDSSRSIIDYGINVTYIGECVKITTKFINNHTADKERGIKKNRSTTFSVGLRTLSY